MINNAERIKGKKLKVYSDNKNVHSILAKGSSKSDLQSLSLSIYEICNERGITLISEWLARRFNEAADSLSKTQSGDEWTLCNWVFQYLDKGWGPHLIDRFASNLNNKCQKFNSRY